MSRVAGEGRLLPRCRWRQGAQHRIALGRLPAGIGLHPGGLENPWNLHARQIGPTRGMAGGAAEEVLLNREPIGTGSDDPKIAELLTDADDELALRREVKLFLAANYPTLLRIADALTRRGVLSGEEVRKIVRGRSR